MRQDRQNWSLARLALFRLALGLLRFADMLLQGVDVDERQDGAVDPVVGRSVRAYLHPIPVTVAILHLRLSHDEVFDDLGDSADPDRARRCWS